MNIQIDLIDERLNEIRDLVTENIQDPGRHFDRLIRECNNLLGEDKLYYVFLTTHFDNISTAKELYQILDWNSLNKNSDKKIFSICNSFFGQKRRIGDHRRHFRCMKWGERGPYTTELLISYRKIMNQHSSQNDFFEIAKKPEFNFLYNKLKSIKYMHTRLPRFDHLEKLARVHSFYTVPERFYAEDSTGPLDGLTQVILGQRYRKNMKQIKKYLLGTFSHDWNIYVDNPYHISPNPTFLNIIQQVEKWFINQIFDKIPKNIQNNPAFIFDLESCLCNWQKGK